jgi:hypothetical protein
MCFGANEEVSTMKIASMFIVVLAISAFQVDMAQAKMSRSPADQDLYERAVRECNSWKYYPNGARIHVNYKKGWFRCDDRRRRKK